jgi:prepilin-type N-terminal cleavage/methylation domain-containing protein
MKPRLVFRRDNNGFTILELLITIIVIGILSALVYVSYAGVQKSNATQLLKADLQRAYVSLEGDRWENGVYPTSKELANGGEGLMTSEGVVFNYTILGAGYCLTAWSEAAGSSFHVSSEFEGVQEGECPEVYDNFANLEWSERTDLGSGWSDVSVASEGNRVVLSKSSSVIISNNGGATFPVTHSDLTMDKVTVSSNGSRMVGAYNSCGPGSIRRTYISSNSGASWTLVAESVRAFTVRSSSSGQKVVAAGCEWDFNVSNDYGSTWTTTSYPGSYIMNAAISPNGNRIFVSPLNISTNSGYLLTSTDFGQNWTEYTNLGLAIWDDVASSADGTKIITAARDGMIYTSSDAGASWSARSSAGSRKWRSMSSSYDGTKLVAGVSPGYIYTSTDSGASWTEQTDLGLKSWTKIETSADGSKIFAIGSGVLHIGEYGP